MATSSSDESVTAPKDFHLSSSVDSGSRTSPTKQKCPLCSKSRKTFYCKECIHSGDFYNSVSLYAERYADKQLRLLQLKAAKKSIEERCLDLLKKKQILEQLTSQIRQSKERVHILQLAVNEKKENQNRRKNKLANLIGKNNKLSKNLPKYEEKVEKLGGYVSGKREEIERSKERLLSMQDRLKYLTRMRISQLMKYIFPISIVQPKSELESGELDMVSALAEASRTTYIRDRWVYTDSSGELQHCIVAPTLPGSGNYSAYNVWVAQNKDAVPGSGSLIAIEHNPAYGISAALTYTAQLVNVLAFYLDVRLPYKMLYSDFCSNDMTEHQFSRRVARLNANVLHLCFSQNTQMDSLHPSHTLHNVLQLIDDNISDLGRQGPMAIDTQTVENMEEQILSEFCASEDSDSEEGDALPYEWEAVPHVQCPEISAGPATLPSTQMMSTQQASSVAGGLVTSAAASIVSLWRGWTQR